MEFLPTTDDSGSAEVVISSGGLDVAEVVVEHVEETEPIPDPENARAPPMSIACQTDCPRGLVTIEHIQDNDIQMAMMTGLENYRKFSYVLQSLGPAAYRLQYRWSQSEVLTVENQFLLTLMKLRRHYSNKELSMFFAVSEKTVSNVFCTWINFMYFQWRELDIWPSKDLVAYFSPMDFNKKFPKTRIIVDATEIPINKPKAPEAQQKTWSSYKNQNTLKVLVGCTPGGLVNYVSHAYGGSASDRLMCERSTLMTSCDPGDVVMSDKGFNVQDLFAPYDVTLNLPTFMTGKNQLPPQALAKDRKIASKRVLVERIIGLAKTYKILTSQLTDNETYLGTQIIFACFMLCNFRGCIVPEMR